MNFFSFTLLVVLLGVAAIAASRKIRLLKAQKTAPATGTTLKAETTPGTLSPLAQRFRSWSEQAFAADPQLVAWLQTLSEPALEAFANEMAAFAHEVRIDLSWLLDRDLSHHPTTRTHVTAMLLHYCQAWYCAVKVQQEVHTLQSWDQFNQNPDDPAHQPLLQALWAQLVTHQLIPPVNGEMLIAAPDDQQAYMLQSIRTVAEREPKRFYGLLPAAVAAA